MLSVSFLLSWSWFLSFNINNPFFIYFFKYIILLKVFLFSFWMHIFKTFFFENYLHFYHRLRRHQVHDACRFHYIWFSSSTSFPDFYNSATNNIGVFIITTYFLVSHLLSDEKCSFFCKLPSPSTLIFFSIILLVFFP